METKINHISISQKGILCSFSTQNGFLIYLLKNFQLLFSQKMKGEIGPIDVIETSNIVALTGTGIFPAFNPEILYVMNLETDEILVEILIQKIILKIQFFNEFLIVVTEYSISIFNHQFQQVKTLQTSFNFDGLVALSGGTSYSICSICNSIKQEEYKGQFFISEMNSSREQQIVKIHQSFIVQLKMSQDGQFIASISQEGSSILIYSLEINKVIKKCKYFQKQISGLCFSEQNDWVAAVGDDGYLTLWKFSPYVKLEQTLFSKLKSLLTNEEPVFEKIKINNQIFPKVNFTQGNFLLIFSYKGIIKEFKINPLEEQREMVINQ